LFVVLSVASAGCTAPAEQTEDEGASQVSSAIDVENGREINGREINGREQNGREINGPSLGSGPGVWFVKHAGTYDAPAIVDTLAPRQRGGVGLNQNKVTVGLRTVAVHRGELQATYLRPGASAVSSLRGAQFKDVILRAMGPRPYVPPMVLAPGAVIVRGGLLPVGPGSTRGFDPGVLVAVQAPSPSETVRAYVQELQRRTDTGLRELDVRVTSAVSAPPNDAHHAGRRETLWHYKVQVRNGAAWEDYCSDGRSAIAVPESWDMRQGVNGAGGLDATAKGFTFACDGSAIAKCVEKLGYAPWGTTEVRRGAITETVSKRPLLDACVRMIRADYCGNGVSMTRDGTTIDLDDSAGVNEAEAQSWPHEAKWTERGAQCGEYTRQIQVPSGAGTAQISVQAYIAAMCPNRFGQRDDSLASMWTMDQCTAVSCLSTPGGAGAPGGAPGGTPGGTPGLSGGGTGIARHPVCNQGFRTDYGVMWTRALPPPTGVAKLRLVTIPPVVR